MKRVQIMLSSIVVLAIVAGALAFKAKSPDVCAYAKSGNFGATVACPLIVRDDVETAPGSSSQYATTLATVNNTCPTTETICPQNFTTIAE
jgi:hypothetical protein